MSLPPITRRRALASATTVGLTLPVLSACGDDADTTGAGGPTSTAAEPTSASTSAPATDNASEPATSGGGIVSTADVPVGSGVILPDASVVVTQPTDGDLRVFSINCTHTGCAVTGISDRISCPCHGSTFDLDTGDVLGGPAGAPLPKVDFTVEGDQVVLS